MFPATSALEAVGSPSALRFAMQCDPLHGGGSSQAEIPLRVALRTPPSGAMLRVEARATMPAIKEAP